MEILTQPALIIFLIVLLFWILTLGPKSKRRALGWRLKFVASTLERFRHMQVDFRVVSWEVRDRDVVAYIENELGIKKMIFDCSNRTYINIKVWSNEKDNSPSEVNSIPDGIYDWIKFFSSTIVA